MANYYARRRKRFRLLADVLAILILFALVLVVYRYAATQEPTVGKAHIIDGDTVIIDNLSIRLMGIDAPEMAQTCIRYGKPYSCGKVAKNTLRKKISGRRLRCEGWQKDRYQRLLATCYLQNQDSSLNQTMVRLGWAVSYYDYASDEKFARSNKLGIWAGKFQLPSDWRRESKPYGNRDESLIENVWQWVKNIAGL